jgi:4-azaleucine resistance transporter AzlC
MTGLNFGGGSEFAAVELWTSPPHVLLIVAITFLVNSRHLLMGAAMAPLIRHLSRRKAFAVLFLMCDESWAMGLADARRSGSHLSLGCYLGVALGLYGCWIAVTTIGALVGPVLGDVTRYGLDMAFPAVFLVMLAGMWKGPAAARPWLVSLVVAATTYLLAPGSWYVPAGAVSGVVAAYFFARPS